MLLQYLTGASSQTPPPSSICYSPTNQQEEAQVDEYDVLRLQERVSKTITALEKMTEERNRYRNALHDIKVLTDPHDAFAPEYERVNGIAKTALQGGPNDRPA